MHISLLPSECLFHIINHLPLNDWCSRQCSKIFYVESSTEINKKLKTIDRIKANILLMGALKNKLFAINVIIKLDYCKNRINKTQLLQSYENINHRKS